MTTAEVMGGNIWALMNWHKEESSHLADFKLCYHKELADIEDKLQRERSYARGIAAKEGIVIPNWGWSQPAALISVKDLLSPLMNPLAGMADARAKRSNRENSAREIPPQPEPAAQSPSGFVKLFGPDDCPILNNKAVNKLSAERYEFAKYVLEVQTELAKQGIDKGPLTDELRVKFEGSYRGIYAFFTQDSPEWKESRRKGKKGEGFRFK